MTQPYMTHWKATTTADREAAYQNYLERSEPYFRAIAERGGSPWFSSEGERRALFFRRWVRPVPPLDDSDSWWPFAAP